MFWLILAVIVDSAVTLFVGWRLEKAAKKHTAAAAESIKPVFQKEIGDAIHNIMPLIVPFVKRLIDDNNAVSSPINNEISKGAKYSSGSPADPDNASVWTDGYNPNSRP